MITVLCGPPGSGKSTWAASNVGTSVILTADAFRRNRNQRMMNQLHGIMLIAPDYLRKGQDLIIDATAARQEHRAAWIQMARKAHTEASIIRFNTPLQTCLERNKTRGRQAVPEHIVRQQHAMITNAKLHDEPWHQVVEL